MITITNVGVIQTIMATRTPLAIDGLLGPQTLRAFTMLPKDQKSAVSGVARMLDVHMIADDYTSKFVSTDRVTSVAAQVSMSSDAPISYLTMTVGLENYGASKDSGFIVETNGKYQGLGQFDETTWNAVMQNISFDQAGKTMPAITAIARLYERNKRSFVIQGNDPDLFSNNIAYLYHNQGAGNALYYLTSGELVYPGQSSHALRVFEQAKTNYDHFST